MTVLAFYPAQLLADPVPVLWRLVEQKVVLQHLLLRIDFVELTGDAVCQHLTPSRQGAFPARWARYVRMAGRLRLTAPLLPLVACAATGQMAQVSAHRRDDSAKTAPRVLALASLGAPRPTKIHLCVFAPVRAADFLELPILPLSHVD